MGLKGTWHIWFRPTAFEWGTAAATCHKEASFRFQEAPDAPSVLMELGYLSDPIDAKHLVEPYWQKKTAASMVKAIDD